MRRALALALALAASAAALLSSCGGGAAATTPAPTTPAPTAPTTEAAAAEPMPPALAPLAWMLGDWAQTGRPGSLHWVTAAGAMYGVELGAGADQYGVFIIDDGPDGGGPADGVVRLILLARGDGGQELTRDGGDAASIDFRITGVDAKEARVRYAAPDRDRLVMTIEPATGIAVPVALARTAAAPAPEAEAADRAFDVDTARDGADGWTRYFADDGILWRGPGDRLVGKDAIRASMVKTLERIELRWQPVFSGLQASGPLAFTVGTWTATSRKDGTVGGRGSYVTVWRKTADGWLVAFDTGRPLHDLAQAP